MGQRDYRSLIDRGRKAGLGTGELYRALAAQPAETNLAPGQTDGNGFVPHVNRHGQRIFQPIGSYRRP